VTTNQNFDILNFPQDHCSRSPSDTFYVNNKNLLRTHTSAHQVELLKKNL
jgi:phenylalanyl-tRNA synthetase alpha chain